MGTGLRNVLIVCWLALAVAGCQPSAEVAPKRGSCPESKVCLHIGNGAEPISLDPHQSTGTWEDRIIGGSLMGLTQDDPEGNAVPGMAEHWETSADGLVWTFYLRAAFWSDGVPVGAEDFVFSLRRILLPETAAEYASLLYLIEGAQAVNGGEAAPETLAVRAISPKVLEIRLTHPAPYLTELTKHATMYPVPKHAVEKFGDAWSQPENYVVNGPYLITAWRLGDYVKQVKNPRFYEADKVCVDEIYHYPTTDWVSSERRVRRGELDIAHGIQSNRVDFLREQIPDYVRTHTWLGTSYLAFNTNDPQLKDPHVRQALSMAIDRDFITGKLLRGGQEPAYTFVPPGIANYRNPGLPEWSGWSFERRQAAARRLLTEAGYGPDNPLKIEIKHRNSADPMLVMPAIQSDWRQIGVDASLRQNEVQIAYASYRNRDFQVADAGWIADYNDAMSFLYLQQSTTGPQNYGDYRNPAFDALLTQADNEPDTDIRSGHLGQAEMLMLQDAPIVPTYFAVNSALVSPKITGYADNIVNNHRIRYLCVQNAGGA